MRKRIWVSMFIAGIMLFSLSQNTRGYALDNRSQCLTNLKQLGLAMHMFAQDNGGKFPVNLVLLQPKYISSLELLICPGYKTALSTKTTGTGSYVYVKGLSEQDYAQALVMYDASADNHGGQGRNVLFVDGHVEYVPEGRFQPLLKKFMTEFKDRVTLFEVGMLTPIEKTVNPRAESAMKKPQENLASFTIFSTNTDSASADILMHIITGDDKSISVAKTETLQEALASKSEVLVFQIGPDNNLIDIKEINDDTLNALKGRKVIGIGYGAAQLFGKLDLEINEGVCASNPRDYTPKISIEKDGLIKASGIKEPIIAFDSSPEKEHAFDSNSAMFIPRKDPMCSVVEAIARWVGGRPGEENYAPIARQGNYVMVGLNAPVNTWTADYRKFFHELAIALRDRKSEPFSVAKWEVTKPGTYNFNLAKSLSTDELFSKNRYFQFTRPGKLVIHLEQKGSNSIMLIFGGQDTTNHWIRKDALKGEPLEISVDITADDIQNIGQKYWRLDVANFDWEHESKCSLRIDYQ